MSYKPQRTFNGQPGGASVDSQGPIYLSRDIDNINKMFDPASTHTGGQQGGISKDNLNFTITNDYDNTEKSKVTASYNHISKTNNPHNVTKSQIGLGNVDNKSESTIKNDFAGSISSGNDGFVKGGEVYTALDNKISKNNPIQGNTKCKITFDSKGLVTSGDNLSANDIPSIDASKITSGTFANERIASANTWNSKQNALISGINIKTINNNSILGSGNLQVSSDNVFWAIPDTTSFTEINEKIINGCIVLCKIGLFSLNNTYVTFIATRWFEGFSEQFDYAIEFTALGDFNYLSFKVTYTESGNVTHWESYSIKGIQQSLVSGTNIKTINNQSILGSGNINSGVWGQITGTLSNQTDLSTAITGKQNVIPVSTEQPTGQTIGDMWYKHIFTPPVKGQIINLNLDGTSKQFRVLKINGTNAEILGMSERGQVAFGSTQIYEGSKIDTYLNNYYSTFTNVAKLAIVDKTFTQDKWYLDASGTPQYNGYSGPANPGTTSYTISLRSTEFGNTITRHCYALSVQDVLDYVLDTSIGDGQLQNYNIWKMFWDDEVSHQKNLWLRTASGNFDSNILAILGSTGRISDGIVTRQPSVYYYRAAMTIDLSKIDWS